MRKILLAFMALAALHMSGAVKIVALSDVHAMSEKLIAKPGEAIDKQAAADMRMIKQSADILRTTVKEIIKERPQVVLISGDLTKDGERLSHEFVVAQLELLRAQGIKVLVVPGNHDISNAHAKSFQGAKTKSAATITRDDFRQLYARFGHGAGVQRDTSSLSFAAEPVAGLVVIGIDSNRDEENLLKSRGDSVNTYNTAGRIKPATLQWVAARVREARAQGKQVVGMMHHHLIEHFDQEAKLLEKYVVADYKNVRNTLVDAGLRVMLTGHLHITDIARDYIGGDSITEVATSSLVTYPFHYRTITIDDGVMRVDTRQIKAVPSCKNLLAEGRLQVEKAVPALLDGMLNRALAKMDAVASKFSGMMALFGGGSFDLSKMKSGMKQVCHAQFDDLATRAMLALYEGNEGENPDTKHVIEEMEKGMNMVMEASLPAGIAEMVQEPLRESVMPKFHNLLRSILEDRNHCGTPQEVIVNDKTTSFKM
ncbi:MAG: metallophosphoesterase [Bacteroidales bacterium]|nr:metallophosphoesterase [Bacteroidales bacterium]